MKAPPARSLAEEGTALERRLLESAHADAMPAASLERLARALSVPNVAPAGSGATPSRLARQGLLTKLGAFGLVGAMAGAAALRWLGNASDPPERSAPAEIAPAETAPAETKAPAAPLVEAPDPRGRETSHAPARASAVAATARRPRPARASTHPAAPSEARSDVPEAHGLRAELSAVESVQRTLRAGQFSEAERGLAAYWRRFPNGELVLEAELLRVDLDAARGDLERARAHARKLLARPGAARYRARLEALMRDRTD
jgi:hypothetical protein